MLEIQGLTKRYGDVLALDDASPCFPSPPCWHRAPAGQSRSLRILLSAADRINASVGRPVGDDDW
jgi:hypothetical protein